MIRRFHVHIGLACAIIGAAIWAFTVAITTPAAAKAENAAEAAQSVGSEASPTDLTGGELHLWAQELREAAIVLAVAGLLFAIHRFRGAALISVITGGILLIADLVIDSHDGSGGRLAISIAAAAALLGLLAFGFAQGVGERSRHKQRPTLVMLAVIAAYCAPAVFIHTPSRQNTEFLMSHTPASYMGFLFPIGLYLGTAIVAVALAALAGFSAVLCIQPQPRVGVAACIVGVPVAIVGAIGASTGMGLYSNFAGDAASQATAALSLPLAAAAVLLMQAHSGKLRRLRFRIALIAGSVLLAVPMALFAMLAAFVFGERLMNAAGYSFPADGAPYLPGALLFAVILGFLARALNKKQTTVESDVPDPNAAKEVSPIAG